jgi:hypothetical protein
VDVGAEDVGAEVWLRARCVGVETVGGAVVGVLAGGLDVTTGLSMGRPDVLDMHAVSVRTAREIAAARTRTPSHVEFTA